MSQKNFQIISNSRSLCMTRFRLIIQIRIESELKLSWREYISECPLRVWRKFYPVVKTCNPQQFSWYFFQDFHCWIDFKKQQFLIYCTCASRTTSFNLPSSRSSNQKWKGVRINLSRTARTLLSPHHFPLSLNELWHPLFGQYRVSVGALTR